MAISSMAANPFDAQQKHVLRVLKACNGAMSRSQLTRKLQTSPAYERDRVIENLLETGRLKECCVKSATKSATWYHLPEVSPSEFFKGV